MKAYFYLLMNVLIIVVGITGCKNLQKVAKKEQTTPAAVIVKDDSCAKESESGVNSREEGQAVNTLTSRQERSPLTIVTALPNVIIYKTKADYSKNVPVGLNHEKTAITSYPGKTDIKYRKMPMPLEYGYLLDNHGISLNAAFLKYTYEEYLELEEIPSIAELFNDIIDADPLIEMYNCGKTSDFQQGNIAEQLNKMLLRSEGKPGDFFRKLK